MTSLKGIFKEKGPEVVLDTYDTMVDCRGCENRPNISSIACLRCCSEKLSDRDFDDMTFRSAEDIQFRGDSAKIIRRLVTIVPGSCSTLKDEKRCRDCPLSRHAMMERMWSNLSVEGIESVATSIDSITIDCKSFDQCKAGARTSLDVMRDDLSSLVEEMSFVANRIVGV